jgi:prophage regulatory protein
MLFTWSDSAHNLKENNMTEERFLKIDDVQMMTTLSSSEIKRRAQKGTFPNKVRLGAQRSAWVFSEVQLWIQNQIKDDRFAA